MRKLFWFVALGVLVAVTFAVVDLTHPPWYERLRYPLRYAEYVRVHAQRHHLDPALLAAVIYQESRFRPDAKSSSGAIGRITTSLTGTTLRIRPGRPLRAPRAGRADEDPAPGRGGTQPSFSMMSSVTL